MALIRQGLGLGDVRLQRGDLALSVCYNKIDDVLVAQCDRPDVLNIAPARHLQATRGSGILTTEIPRLIKLTGEIPDPCASVIFVHGLGGGPRDTWQRASDPKSFWPLWLAED